MPPSLKNRTGVVNSRQTIIDRFSAILETVIVVDTVLLQETFLPMNLRTTSDLGILHRSRRCPSPTNLPHHLPADARASYSDVSSPQAGQLHRCSFGATPTCSYQLLRAAAATWATFILHPSSVPTCSRYRLRAGVLSRWGGGTRLPRLPRASGRRCWQGPRAGRDLRFAGPPSNLPDGRMGDWETTGVRLHSSGNQTDVVVDDLCGYRDSYRTPRSLALSEEATYNWNWMPLLVKGEEKRREMRMPPKRFHRLRAGIRNTCCSFIQVQALFGVPVLFVDLFQNPDVGAWNGAIRSPETGRHPAVIINAAADKPW